MDVNIRVFKAYLNHFLPRGVIGPVLIVFSLEGVIDGVFSLYVQDELATVGWGIVFVLSLLIVAYWGTTDEPAVEALQERIEELQEDEAGDDDRAGPIQ